MDRRRRHEFGLLQESHRLQQARRFAVAMYASDVDVCLSIGDALRAATSLQISVYQRAEVLIPAPGFAPKSVQRSEDATAERERAPHPAALRRGWLHLNLCDVPGVVGQNDIEALRMFDRKQQEAQLPLTHPAQSILRKPNRVRQSDEYAFVVANERQSAEERVTQPPRLVLNHEAHLSAADLASIVGQDIALARRDDEAELGHARGDHAINQILAHRHGSVTFAFPAAADRQQLLRKSQWLNSTAAPSGRNDAPHFIPPRLEPVVRRRRSERARAHPAR